MTPPKENRTHSVSSITTYDMCAAKYWFEKYSGIPLERHNSDAQKRGSTFHAGIAAALVDGTPHQPVGVAVLAAQQYALDNDVSNETLEEALDLLRHYIPLLGINTTLKAYHHEGKPLIEYDFDLTFGKGDKSVKLKGFIDAVVQHSDGRVLLLDWKIHKDLYPLSAVQMDKQLYVYAAVCQRVLGIQLDGAAQVQIRSTLPARPKLNKDKSGTKADDYNARLGQTTAATLERDFAHLSASERMTALLRYADKIVDETDFLSFSKVDVRNADRVLKIVLARAHQMDNDDTYLPILNAYACRACEWQGHCKQRVLG